MKVGDYVRTKKGYIAQYEGIKKYNNIDGEIEDWFIFDSTISDEYEDIVPSEINKSYFIKSSPNIIDLIEENDLLKIEYYSLRYEGRVTRLFEVTYKDKKNINLSNAKCDFMLTNNDFSNSDKELEPIIKSIVTKEQFERMEYKCTN